MAKEAVSSTLKRILIYTAEIIASVFLLIVICIPLTFAIPGWLQHVVFGVPKSDIWINPVALFGADLTVLIIVIMAIISILLCYPLVMKLIPSSEPGEPKSSHKKEKRHEEESETAELSESENTEEESTEE